MLRIFLSSVQREFVEQRRALRDAIGRVQHLFVGMELFGSQSASPREHDDKEIGRADLYLGLLGESYGSVESESGMSFTELEYLTALERQIPTLLYVREDAEPTDPRQLDFKKRVMAAHVVESFIGTEDLVRHFLSDFIGLLSGPLFGKCVPASEALIAADALHAICRRLMPQQIQAIGREKYLPELYVSRTVDREIRDFIAYESFFVERATEHLQVLREINQAFSLSAANPLAAFHSALDAAANSRLQDGLREVQAAFFVSESLALLRRVRDAAGEVDDGEFANQKRNVQNIARALPFFTWRTLRELKANLDELRKAALLRRGRAPTSSKWYLNILRLFPSRKGRGSPQMAYDIVDELSRLVDRQSKRCLALVGPAGHGKTNALCHAATTLLKSYPSILLSGQMELSTQHHIEFYVQNRLESQLRGFFSDWLKRIDADLQVTRSWLVIVIDGINESGNLKLMLGTLVDFLARISERRVKLIISCRDIHWDYFSPKISNFLDGGSPIRSTRFSSTERDQAIQTYFRHFDVECQLDEDGRGRLANPLLMRFFCEAYRGQKLGLIGAPELLRVFDHYLKRAAENISERLELIGPAPVTSLVMRLARSLWEERRETVTTARLGLTDEDLSNPKSVYIELRSENVVFEEVSDAYAMVKSVRFVYDRFMEYLIARSWMVELAGTEQPESAVDRLLHEVAQTLPRFPAALGAVVFLDQMRQMEGLLVSRIIPFVFAADSSFAVGRQVAMLYAFENVNKQIADDELITCLDRFERSASGEVKEALATVILDLMPHLPAHPVMQAMARRLLEVEESKALTTAKTKSADSSPLLPPVRHHYSEQTRLTAIAVLAGGQTDASERLVEEGTRQLGNLALHSALKAVEALDRASEGFVYRMIEQYLRVPSPEYRIYCAWLLRRRYGLRPAGFLLRLLTDDDPRVHQYAFDLIEERGVEADLLAAIVGYLETHRAPAPWYLMYCVKLAGGRVRFIEPSIADQQAESVVKALRPFGQHRHLSIRVEVCRALLAYSDVHDVSRALAPLRASGEVEILRLIESSGEAC